MLTLGEAYYANVYQATADVVTKAYEADLVANEQFFVVVADMLGLDHAPGFVLDGKWVSVVVDGNTNVAENRRALSNANDELAFNAGKLYAVDSWLVNGDRHTGNMAIDGNRVIAFDNEQIFQDHVYWPSAKGFNPAFVRGQEEMQKRIKQLDRATVLIILKAINHKHGLKVTPEMERIIYSNPQTTSSQQMTLDLDYYY